MRRDLKKSINSTWINTRVNKDKIHKVAFSNCNHRVAYLRKWHIQKEIDTTNFISLCDNIDASLNFPALFQTFIILFWASRVRLWLILSENSEIWTSATDSEIFVICWIESVDPMADLCLTNQIYSVLLYAFEFKEITLKCFLKMAKRELAPGRWRMKGDETRPRGFKYPTPPCALAKILPETTVRAYCS